MPKGERVKYQCCACKRWVPYEERRYWGINDDEMAAMGVCDKCDKRLNAAVLAEIVKIGRGSLSQEEK